MRRLIERGFIKRDLDASRARKRRKVRSVAQWIFEILNAMSVNAAQSRNALIEREALIGVNAKVRSRKRVHEARE
jgi:hypothetical protein